MNTCCTIARASAFIFFLLITLPAPSHAAINASQGTGCRQATTEEINAANIIGAKLPSGGQICDGDLKLLTGGCPESPYPYLLQHYTPGTQSSLEGKAGITKLNSDFACRLYRYIKAYPEIKIISAYRSVSTQTTLWNQALQKYGSASAARKWVAPPGNSMHNKALAADLSNVTNDKRTAAPKFGLVFRMAHEGWHIEPNGSVTGGLGNPDSTEPDFPQSAVPQSGNYCITSIEPVIVVPTSGPPGPNCYNYQGNSSATAPRYTAPYSQSFPGAPAPTFAQTPVTSTATPFTTPLSTSNTTSAPICTPQFSCSNNVMYYQTTSCTTQVYQNCTKGCDGNSCANIATTVSSSTLVADPVTKAASSTTELLDAFANPVTFSSSNIATSTSIAVILNGNTSDIEDIVNPTSSSTVDTGTIASIQPLTSQQTFTSTDLVSTGVSSNNAQSTNGVMKILSDLKAALVWAIGYLKSLSTGK